MFKPNDFYSSEILAPRYKVFLEVLKRVTVGLGITTGVEQREVKTT